jgi:hypothetical protein
MPESTLTLCQSRLYPPVRDFGFGFWPLWTSYSTLNLAFQMLKLTEYLHHVWTFKFIFLWITLYFLQSTCPPLYLSSRHRESTRESASKPPSPIKSCPPPHLLLLLLSWVRRRTGWTPLVYFLCGEYKSHIADDLQRLMHQKLKRKWSFENMLSIRIRNWSVRCAYALGTYANAIAQHAHKKLNGAYPPPKIKVIKLYFRSK